MAVLGRTSQLLTRRVEKEMNMTLINYFCSLKETQALLVNARLNIAARAFAVFFFLLFPYFYLLLTNLLSDFCPVG